MLHNYNETHLLSLKIVFCLEMRLLSLLGTMTTMWGSEKTHLYQLLQDYKKTILIQNNIQNTFNTTKLRKARMKISLFIGFPNGFSFAPWPKKTPKFSCIIFRFAFMGYGIYNPLAFVSSVSQQFEHLLWVLQQQLMVTFDVD